MKAGSFPRILLRSQGVCDRGRGGRGWGVFWQVRGKGWLGVCQPRTPLAQNLSPHWEQWLPAPCRRPVTN
uniref:Uncharacterized protein n=1 Tax=Anguilla anguilla TaxID=7936 RepID=A0A0E9SDX9_ANGAN